MVVAYVMWNKTPRGKQYECGLCGSGGFTRSKVLYVRKANRKPIGRCKKCENLVKKYGK